MNYEKKRLAGMNIIICTPGRLLQHMDENELFSTEQLQMLVIDEADRILDMGFRKQVAQSEATNVTKSKVVPDGRNPGKPAHQPPDAALFRHTNTSR